MYFLARFHQKINQMLYLINDSVLWFTLVQIICEDLIYCRIDLQILLIKKLVTEGFYYIDIEGEFLEKTFLIRDSDKTIYRVTGLKLYLFRTQIFHLRNNFMMFKIRFYILQIMTFYDISSFFDLSKVLFHKLIFFKKKNFFLIFFFKKFFFLIFFVCNGNWWFLKNS